MSAEVPIQNAFSWIIIAYSVGFIGLSGAAVYLLLERRRLKQLLRIANDQE